MHAIEAARRSQFNLRNTALVLLLLDTGLRASEVCSLKKKDVDLAARLISVIGKGNKRRTVFFSAVTSRALHNYLRGGEWPPDRAVFRALDGAAAGEPLTRSGLYQIISKLGRDAGLQGVRCSPHTLRHTFATEFIRNEGYQDTVQQGANP